LPETPGLLEHKCSYIFFKKNIRSARDSFLLGPSEEAREEMLFFFGVMEAAKRRGTCGQAIRGG
jgi:hypothetical protein